MLVSHDVDIIYSFTCPILICSGSSTLIVIFISVKCVDAKLLGSTIFKPYVFVSSSIAFF
jgi:hypothetical protein